MIDYTKHYLSDDMRTQIKLLCLCAKAVVEDYAHMPHKGVSMEDLNLLHVEITTMQEMVDRLRQAYYDAFEQELAAKV